MKQVTFDFLDNLELESVDAGATRLGIIDKQPTGMKIRLFNDGRVFPSNELIEKFQLQYVAKGNPDQGYGADVFSTKDWGQWPQGANHLVLISFVPKSLSKVDLFSLTKYDEDGKPKADVAKQGTSTFGKFLMPKLEETYGEDFFADGTMYVDLEVIEDHPVKPVGNGIYNIPKPITKGKKAGTIGYERRENVVLYPLVPAVPVTEESKEEKVEESVPSLPEEGLHSPEAVSAEELPVSESTLEASNHLFNNN